MKNSPFEHIPRWHLLAAGGGDVSTLAWSAAPSYTTYLQTPQRWAKVANRAYWQARCA